MLRDFLRDTRHGLRQLRRSPGFALAAAVTLALGIGASTATFGLSDAIFFRPLPVRNPDQLVSLYSFSMTGAGWSSTSYPNYLDYREADEVFSGLTAYVRASMGVHTGNRTEILWGELITSNYFDVLGISPALGRSFRPDEDRARGPEPFVILAHTLWQRAFGGDPRAVGRTVRIYGRNFTVVGVAPLGFRGVTLDWGKPPAFWIPLPWIDVLSWSPGRDRSVLEMRDAHMALVVGRLRPGIALETAQAALDVRAERLSAAYPDNRDWGVRVVTGREARFWPGYRGQVGSYLGFLAGTVGFVLLLACVNLASLLLARGAAREREVAIRLALGASRGRLVGQLLAEGLVLAALALGAASAWALARFVAAYLRGVSPADPAVLGGAALVLIAAALTACFLRIAPLAASRRPLCGMNRFDDRTTRSPKIGSRLPGMCDCRGIRRRNF